MRGTGDSIRTRRSISGYGSGRRTTWSSTEKIATIAAIPSASVPAAAIVNDGL
jgi:hypothetical protein